MVPIAKPWTYPCDVEHHTHEKCLTGARKMLQLRVVCLTCTIIQFLAVLCNRSHYYSKTTTIKPMMKLLNKFHQNDYRMTFERIEKARNDKRYVDYECRTYKYNRTTPVANSSCTFHFDVGIHMEVIIQAYKFSSNEYRPFPIHFQVNFCEAIASEIVGLRKLTKMGDISCPLVKGRTYHMYNFAPEPERFPPLIPDGHYMVELQFMYHNIELFVVHAYGIIDRPILIPDS